MRVAHLALVAGLIPGMLGRVSVAEINSMVIWFYPQIGDDDIWVDTYGPDHNPIYWGPYRANGMSLLNSSQELFWTYTEYGHVASSGPITVQQYQSNHGRYRINAGGDYRVNGAGAFSYTLDLTGSGTILSVSGLPSGSLLAGDNTSTIGGAVSASGLGTSYYGFSGIRMAGISSGGSLSLGATGGNITATGSIDGSITVGNYSGTITAQSISGTIQLASGSATISAPAISGVIRVTSNFTGTIEANGLTPETIPPEWSITPACGWYVKNLSTGNRVQVACPMPEQASNPSPAHNASGVSLNPTLTWAPGSYATSHNIYFWSDGPREFRGNQVGIAFDPGQLLPSKTYYWQIEEVNGTGTTNGPVWSFSTQCSPPGPAANPSPAHGATGVPRGTALTWIAGEEATFHDVYLWTEGEPLCQGRQTDAVFDPGFLLASKTYHWRVDEVNGCGTTEGVTWTFTTECNPPGQAASPWPTDYAQGVPLNLTLTWTAGLDATSHKVYLWAEGGTPEFRASQAGSTFNTGPLSCSTTYNWRIDEVNECGTSEGTVWSFTTQVDPGSRVVRVDTTASGTPVDGSSWSQAFRSLQAALQYINDHPPANHEVWVARGTYTPTNPSGRGATFQLMDDVEIYGGFPQGGGDGLFSARNPEAYETILSGDVGIQGVDTDNCYHVVTGNNTTTSAVLDGVTIEGGNSDVDGGGVYIRNGSPRIQNCVLRGNRAAYSGGAILIYQNASPNISRCSFFANVAGSDGGAVCSAPSGSFLLENCVFSGNRAKHGGAMRALLGGASVVNCTFSSNIAEAYAGGIFASTGTSVSIANCILWGDIDPRQVTPPSKEIYSQSGGTTTVTYSIVEGGWTGGTQVLDSDPFFIDPDGPDGTAGTPDDNLRVIYGSPCIDSGDNAAVSVSNETDRDGRARRMDDPGTIDSGSGTAPVVDRGAYESLSLIASPASINVPEDRTSSFTVALSGDPGRTVQVSVARISGDEDISVQAGSSLTFDSTNYGVPQTVTLGAATDCDVANGEAVFQITAAGAIPATIAAAEVDSASSDTLVWVQKNPAIRPSARADHAMAYDHLRGKVVLFGGQTANGDNPETWEWDGETETWTLMLPTNSPPAQHGHAMGSSGPATVIGIDNGQMYNWVWSGETWTAYPMCGPALDFAAVTCDMAGLQYLSGGRNLAPQTDPTDEVRVFAEDDLCEQVDPLPSARSGHALDNYFDALKSGALMFGGSDGYIELDDTWMFWGCDWMLRSSYLATAGRTGSLSGMEPIAAGGGAAGWVPLAPTCHPSARSGAQIAAGVLFGGYGPLPGGGAGYLSDTWVFVDGDPPTWRESGAPGPTARNGHAMVLDVARNVIVLFGGRTSPTTLSDETWELDLNN